MARIKIETKERGLKEVRRSQCSMRRGRCWPCVWNGKTDEEKSKLDEKD